MVPALGSAEKSKITEYKDVRGYILFRKPADIRIIGLYPVVRSKAFDMVSNGTDFRLYLPSKNRFIIGRNELTAPLRRTRSRTCGRSIFWRRCWCSPCSRTKRRCSMNFTDEDNAVYILHFVRDRSRTGDSCRRAASGSTASTCAWRGN